MCVCQFPPDRAFLLVDREALLYNYRFLLERARKKSRHARLIAVVKANAYGHGLSLVLPTLLSAGCDLFAVATLDEGKAARALCAEGEILILGYTPPTRVSELCRHRLTQTVFSREYAAALSKEAKRGGCRPTVHLKLDCGMHRLGFAPSDTDALLRVATTKNLRVTGLFTHFPASNTDTAATRRALDAFLCCRAALAREGLTLFSHAANSGAVLTLPEGALDAVRPGLSLYGISPVASERGLRPVLSLHAPVVQLRTLSAGTPVGYSGAFVTERRTVIGVLPIGYADGFSRRMSALPLSVNTRKGARTVRVSGLICMDQTMVDLTGAHARVGDTVTLLENAAAAASAAGLTPYELLSGLSNRITRKFK